VSPSAAIPTTMIPAHVIVSERVVVCERVIVSETVVSCEMRAVGMSMIPRGVRVARVMCRRVRVPGMSTMGVPAAMSAALGEGRRCPDQRECENRGGCHQLCACHDKSPRCLWFGC
jgi:hypothetical protein